MTKEGLQQIIGRVNETQFSLEIKVPAPEPWLVLQKQDYDERFSGKTLESIAQEIKEADSRLASLGKDAEEHKKAIASKKQEIKELNSSSKNPEHVEEKVCVLEREIATLNRKIKNIPRDEVGINQKLEVLENLKTDLEKGFQPMRFTFELNAPLVASFIKNALFDEQGNSLSQQQQQEYLHSQLEQLKIQSKPQFENTKQAKLNSLLVELKKVTSSIEKLLQVIKTTKKDFEKQKIKRKIDDFYIEIGKIDDDVTNLKALTFEDDLTGAKQIAFQKESFKALQDIFKDPQKIEQHFGSEVANIFRDTGNKNRRKYFKGTSPSRGKTLRESLLRGGMRTT